MSMRFVIKVLPWNTGSQELREYFSKFGQVLRSKVLYEKETGLSKGIGFITLREKEGIQSLLENRNHIIDGKKVMIIPKNDKSIFQ